MVSKPYCGPRRLARAAGYVACQAARNKPLADRVTQLLLPPGSAFKIVTLTAAIDSGRFKLSDVFTGADAWGPSPYFDNLAYPSNVTRADLTELTLSQALAFSDNFTFAHIGVTLGQNTFLKYAYRYGIDRPIPFDFPVRASIAGDGKHNLTVGELARSSFGAEDDQVTPLQMAVIAETVANEGLTMAPHLTSSIKAAGGQTLWRYRDHPLRRVMSAASAKTVTDGMSFVVNHGSGYLAQIHGVQVAGKTGTAASGGYYPHAWFIAFAPARHPIIAVAVLHEFSGEGFKYAAPIARKVIMAALRERGFRVH
jgi:peptidoglycan glycosyltransferase